MKPYLKDPVFMGVIILFVIAAIYGVIMVGLQEPKGEPLSDFAHWVTGSTKYVDPPTRLPE